MTNEIERTATPWEENKKGVADALYQILSVDMAKALEWVECLNSFSEEPLKVKRESGEAGVLLKVLGKDCRINFTKSLAEGTVSIGVIYDDGFLFQDCTARGRLTGVELHKEKDESLLFPFEGGKVLGITKDNVSGTWHVNMRETKRT